MTDKETPKQLHDRLVRFLLENGERFDKKHGNWIKFQISSNKYLQMDSWNKAIELKEGNAEYNYWTGFSGVRRIYFGIDWGGFSPSVPIQVYNSMLSCLKINF